jgi:hypothetical protein
MKKQLLAKQKEEILTVLKTRFEKNKQRHKSIEWAAVERKLATSDEKLWSLSEMEKTGGEPDVVAYDKKKNEFLFYDCSPETPKGRLSLCYDKEALNARKEHKPKGSAMDLANAMGITILTEEEYRELQSTGNYDTKTSSWLNTPADIRKLGGSIFGDWRFGRVFVYHNGAQSYYGSRGFRGALKV